MPVYQIDGITPVVHESAYVHPTAVLIGDVIVEAGCYIGPCASLRGDFGRLIVKTGGNLQDGCVMHGFPGSDTVVEADGHIGHGAILHGCHIGQNALVGMNATVMDGAIIPEDSLVAAMSFVKPGFTAPPRSMIMGSPATVTRSLSETEIANKRRGTQEYQRLTQRCMASLRVVAPLRELDEDRPRIHIEGLQPLHNKAGQ